MTSDSKQSLQHLFSQTWSWRDRRYGKVSMTLAGGRWRQFRTLKMTAAIAWTGVHRCWSYHTRAFRLI